MMAPRDFAKRFFKKTLNFYFVQYVTEHGQSRKQTDERYSAQKD